MLANLPAAGHPVLIRKKKVHAPLNVGSILARSEPVYLRADCEQIQPEGQQ